MNWPREVSIGAVLGFEAAAQVTSDAVVVRHRRVMTGLFLEVEDIKILNLAFEAALAELARPATIASEKQHSSGITQRSVGSPMIGRRTLRCNKRFQTDGVNCIAMRPARLPWWGNNTSFVESDRNASCMPHDRWIASLRVNSQLPADRQLRVRSCLNFLTSDVSILCRASAPWLLVTSKAMACLIS